VLTSNLVLSVGIAQSSVMAVGYVDAWERASGQQCWSFNGDSGVGLEGGVAGIAVARDDGIYLLQGSGTLRSLDPRSGQEQWRYATGKPIHTSPVIADEMVLLVTDDGELSAIDATKGTRGWRFQAQDVVRASPTIATGRVIVASWDGLLHALTLDGRHLGSAQLGDAESARATRIVSEGDLILAFDLSARAVRAFDMCLQAQRATCVERWRVPTGSDSDVTPLPVGDRVCWVQSDERVITCVETNSGTTLWRQPSDAVPLAGLISDGKLIVATRDGELAAFDPATGEAPWRMHTSVSFSSPPAIANGIAFVGGVDRALYAIRLP
jgi:outer membrane protein assembly factor BamB